MNVHILQKDIIDQLRQAESLRYSELQPRDIESSHFKYHLNQLIKDGLVEQESRGVYKLTTKGRTFVDRLSAKRVNPHVMPKLITYTLLEDADNYYLYRKDKDPYRDLLNMIGGKAHVGETSQQSAIREVFEKTKVSIPELTLCGVADIQIKNEDTLLTHVTAYVYRGILKESSELLEKIPKNTLAEHTKLAPDILPLLELINHSSEPFVAQLSLSV